MKNVQIGLKLTKIDLWVQKNSKNMRSNAKLVKTGLCRPSGQNAQTRGYTKVVKIAKIK